MIELTHQQAKEWLSEIFYKPGWDLRVARDLQGRPLLRLIFKAVDSTVYPIDVTRKVDVVQSSYIPQCFLDKREFYRWVESEIVRMERHEAQEWLRSFEDGKPLNDPHERDRRT